jgi:hypothetical protein
MSGKDAVMTMRLLRRVLAVAVIAASAGVVFAAGAASGAPVGWSSNFVSLINVGTNPSFTADSCPIFGDCTAVGDSQNSTANAQPIVARSSGTGWSTGQVLPAPAPPTNVPGDTWETLTMTGVSCASVTFCIAVGNASVTQAPAGTTSQYGLVEEFSGGAWSATALIPPPVPGAPAGTTAGVVSLTGVSCYAAMACYAVGSAEIGKKPIAIAYTLAGGPSSWTVPATLPNPAVSFRSVTLNSVSCSSGSSCVAVGAYFGSVNQQHAFLEELSGSTWSPITPALPPGAASGALTGVSCAGPTCQAVGWVKAPGPAPLEPLVANNGGANNWTDAQLQAPASSSSSSLLGVSCPTAVSCTAVGSYLDSSDGTHALVEGFTGILGWAQTTTVTDPSGATSATLDAVSCPNLCTAVGDGTNTSGSAPFATEESGPALSLSVSAPSNATVGTAVTFTVHAIGPGASAYNGTVDFMSTDRSASLPAPSTLTNGSGTFTVTFGTIGTQTITAFDNVNLFIGGTSNIVTVSGRNVRPPPPPPPPPHGAPTASGGRLFAGLPNGSGYWLASATGGVFSYGAAQFYGSLANLALNQPIVGMAATPDGGGYWLVASDGGVFSFGDAQFFGSTGAIHLNMPIVDMVSTPAGGGYWLVASDGGIFSFGDTQFFGSTGAIHLNEPVVDLASTADGGGYWLVASDGGIFAFGDAPFLGSLGALSIANPIVGMAASRDGSGYWMVGSDGGVYAEGDAAFEGSLGDKTILWPILGIMSNTRGGYSLVDESGAATQFG